MSNQEKSNKSELSSQEIYVLPKWFKLVTNDFLMILIYPTMMWILYSFIVKKLHPVSFPDYLQWLWWGSIKVFILILAAGILLLNISDKLGMELRAPDSNGILRPVSHEQHYNKHIKFNRLYKKIISAYIFFNSLIAPFTAGWGFFGAIVWYFAQNSI